MYYSILHLHDCGIIYTMATFQVYQVSKPQFTGAFSGHGCFFNLYKYIQFLLEHFHKCSSLWFALICPNDPLLPPFPLPLVLFLPQIVLFSYHIYTTVYVYMYICSTYQRKHVIHVFFLFTLSCYYFPLYHIPLSPKIALILLLCQIDKEIDSL